MAKTESEQLLAEIGSLLMADEEYPSEPTLLYAQLDVGMIGESIFKKIDDHFLYRRPLNERLSDALIELWEAQDGNYWWSELEYVVRDGRFEVAYFYPHEIDPEEDVIERRERALHRHFGEKPIIYPPFLTHEEERGYDL